MKPHLRGLMASALLAAVAADAPAWQSNQRGRARSDEPELPKAISDRDRIRMEKAAEKRKRKAFHK